MQDLQECYNQEKFNLKAGARLRRLMAAAAKQPDVDHYVVLGVPRDATPAEIRPIARYGFLEDTLQHTQHCHLVLQVAGSILQVCPFPRPFRTEVLNLLLPVPGTWNVPRLMLVLWCQCHQLLA